MLLPKGKTVSAKRLWLITGIAIFIRILFFVIVTDSQPQGLGNEVNDGTHYLKLAQSILSHYSYAIQYPTGEIKDFFRPPGYPIFIALTLLIDTSLQLLVYLQIVISGLTVFIVGYIAQNVFKCKNYLLPAIFYAIEPNNIAYCTYVSSETLFVFIWMLALGLFFKAWQIKSSFFLYLSAVFWGIALYIRPIAQYGLYLTVFFVLYGTYKRLFSWKNLVLYTLIILALPGIWALRNFIHTGHFVFTAQKGWQMLFFYCASVEQHITGQGFEETQIQFFNRYPTEYMKKHGIIVTDTTNLLTLTNALTFEDDIYFQQEAKKYFEHHYRDFLFSFFKGGMYMLLGVGNWTWESYLGTLQKRGIKQVFDETNLIKQIKHQFYRESILQTLFRIFHFAFLISVYALFIRNVVLNRKNVLIYFLLILILYMMILVAIVMENRYRIPIIAMMLPLTFYDKNPKTKNLM
ncbi:MAG: glycosyltransferase family 39 protein [Bacteroidia bacterium]|nr:glycosyltransferase family 39 protein [Bacteroidia bacterium]MDW8302237.1 glycosyltransferase family 39 protein [Bacteroidia bacterium]